MRKSMSCFWVGLGLAVVNLAQPVAAGPTMVEKGLGFASAGVMTMFSRMTEHRTSPGRGAVATTGTTGAAPRRPAPAPRPQAGQAGSGAPLYTARPAPTPEWHRAPAPAWRPAPSRPAGGARRAPRQASGAALGRRPARPIAAYVTTYAPNPAVQMQAAEAVVQGTATLFGTNVGMMLQQRFGQVGVDADYDNLLMGSGLKNYDLADALTAYMVLNYMIVQDVTVQPDPGDLANLRAAFVAYMKQQHAMPTAAARTAAGERIKAASVALNLLWIEARRSNALDMYRQTVARDFQAETGVDLRTFGTAPGGLIDGQSPDSD